MSIQHFSSSQHNQKTREKNSIPHGHNHTLPRPKKKTPAHLKPPTKNIKEFWKFFQTSIFPTPTPPLTHPRLRKHQPSTVIRGQPLPFF
jgi:hypothetical protein